MREPTSFSSIAGSTRRGWFTRMLAPLVNLPIKYKISVAALTTAAVSLALAGTILLFLQLKEIRSAAVEHLRGITSVIALNTTAAFTFDDPKAATENLSSLRAESRIAAAALYDLAGKEFASYRNPSSDLAVPKYQLLPGPVVTTTSVTISRPIVSDGVQLGTLMVTADLSYLYQRLGDYAFVVFVVLLISVVVAFILSTGFGRFISGPIGYLAELAREISHRGDYSLRAIKEAEDETGYLVDSINSMLAQIQERDRALLESNETLEKRVKERTRELVRSQEQLRHSERLASIGTLAAGVAHEINNPLNSILIAAQYTLRHGGELSEVVKSNLDRIAGEAKRCGNITKGILKFAKRERIEKLPGNLNEVIEQALKLVSNYITKPTFRIDTDLYPKLPPVELNPTELQQVIINLVQNAADACEQQGVVEVKTRIRNGGVRLTVQDTGPGISEEHLVRIFDPFFSTKGQKGGTGLGLSIVHGILSDHNATVSVESAVGKGTLFTIDFPAAASIV